MTRVNNIFKITIFSILILMLNACEQFAYQEIVNSTNTVEDNTDSTINSEETNTSEYNYNLEQAMSDNAQLNTIAFSALAFITGNSAADSFMPPGKVADFFGFQHMRDVDIAGYGHNTLFLSRAANNILHILDDEQKSKLIDLAEVQAPIYVNFPYNRLPLMDAFRRSLEGDIPSSSSALDIDIVAEYTGNLYLSDAELTYNRAIVLGEIINSFSDYQIEYLANLSFNDYNSWPDISEDETLKSTLTNNEFVAVMTYASELFSWYKGSLESDIYFCPERHGTYFGGFFLKDYPAINNPDYFISTEITGDLGAEFLKLLDDDQKELITSIIDEQKEILEEIATIRTEVSTELRTLIDDETIDKDKIFTLIQEYGECDGKMSGIYATRFSQVNETLSTSQKEKLIELRDLDVEPDGVYMFSTLVSEPTLPDNDYLFGIGDIPDDAGQTDTPEGFGN